MGELIFACECLNVELRYPESSAKPYLNDELELVLGGKLLYLEKPQKRVMHDWLLRERLQNVKHCAACNTSVFSVHGDGIVVAENLRRTEAQLESLRLHSCFSECFQIVVDPSNTLLRGAMVDSDSMRKDSLVPGYLESVRLKMVQVVKLMISEKQRIIEEEHRRAMDQLHALQSKCDFQCNTLLKIVEYQENAEIRRSSTTSKSSSSVQRSESTESKGSLQSGKEPALDDDVFEMQFNDEAIYGDDLRVEPAEEARELSGSDNDDDDDDDDERVSTASQERTQKSDMDLSQYATSLPIEVPKEAENWHGGGLKPAEFSRNRLEQSPAKPECIEDIARSMKDLSERMMDDQTKLFGDLPRPRLYTNQF